MEPVAFTPGEAESPVRKSDTLLKFNISGQSFLLSRQLFLADPESSFLSGAFLDAHWNSSLDAYYFNRDPALFGSVLNWFRHGKLRPPSGADDAMLGDELRFWNVTATEQPSEDDERMEKEFVWMEGRYPPPPEGASVSTRNRFAVWSFLTDPLGPHTRFKRASVVYVGFSVALTLLYLVMYGLSTNLAFRDVRIEGLTFENITCPPRLACLAASQPRTWIRALIMITNIYFIAETILRISCCTRHDWYFRSTINWLDLLADAFALLSLTFQEIALADPTETNFLLEQVFMGLQVIRLFRIFQYASLLDGLLVMLLTLRASTEEFLVMTFYLLMGMLFFSTLVTLAEISSDGGITDCLIGYWWAIITMTTVGYGDVSPGATFGYVVGIACALTGLILTSLPVAVIGNNFTIYWEFNQKRKKNKWHGTKSTNKVDVQTQQIENTKL